MPVQICEAASRCSVFNLRQCFDELLRDFKASEPGRRIVRIVPRLIRFGVELLLSLQIHHRSHVAAL